MGLFSFLNSKSEKQFVTENEFKTNQLRQIEMVSETLNELRKLNVDENQKLKLECFFYTNNNAKVDLLTKELEKLEYSIESRQSPDDKKLFLITSWSTKIKMDIETLQKWTSEMCELGYRYDCEFDGWGTAPIQT